MKFSIEKADRTRHDQCLQESSHRQHILKMIRKLKQKLNVFLELIIVLNFIGKSEVKL